MDEHQNGQYNRAGTQYGQYQQYNQYQNREMTQEELPEKFRPLSMWAYFGYSLLYGLPIVGFICVLIFSFGGTKNINHRNFSRSFLCGIIIGFVIIVVVLVALVSSGIFSNFSSYYNYYNY